MSQVYVRSVSWRQEQRKAEAGLCVWGPWEFQRQWVLCVSLGTSVETGLLHHCSVHFEAF